MHRILTATACTAGLFAAADLSTEYRTDRVLVVETTVTFESEVTNSEFLVDGQPPERGPGGGAGGSSSLAMSVVHADRTVAAEDGAPTSVQREFRSLSATNTREAGGEENSNDMTSPLEGVTLGLALEDGEVNVTVADGADLEDAQLEGHLLELALDSLLPGEDVEDGATWDLESDAIRQALGFSRQAVLFPRPEGGGERGGGERGGGGGRRGGARRGGQAGGLAEFRHLDWEGTAELSGTEDYEDVSCWVIELKLEGSGELPEQQGGGRGRGRDRALEPTAGLPSLALETTMEVEIEGRLLLAVEGRRPVLLDLEGSFERELQIEMERGERLIERSQSSEGKFTMNVSVTEEAAE